MKLGRYSRPTVLLAMLGITVGLAACGSSDAGVSTTVPPAATAPTTALTAPTAADAPTVTAVVTLAVTDAEVADLEKQLDDIDQLLVGVDADLKQD